MTDSASLDAPPAQRRRRVWPVMVISVVLAVVSWSIIDELRTDDESNTQPTLSIIANSRGVVEEFPVDDRVSIDRITGATIDGGRFDSAELDGTVIVYNVWGSWCAPCRREAPDLKRLSDAMQDRGVRFVGIDVRDDDASARAFQRKFGITYPSINTADSNRALLELGHAAPIAAVPTTVVVDRQGRAAARIVGIARYYTLKALIVDILNEGS